MMTTTAPDISLAWIIRHRAPHLSDRQLATAVRIDDRRDTFGRKRSDRCKRSPFALVEHDLPAPAAPGDRSPLVAQLVDQLTAIGLAPLIPHLLAGESVATACQLAGIGQSQAYAKIAAIRSSLSDWLTAD